MDDLEKLRDAWARMTEAKCQYCKYFDGRKHPRFKCAWGFYWTWLSLATLQTQDCLKYEWESKLTKEDFIDCDVNETDEL